MTESFTITIEPVAADASVATEAAAACTNDNAAPEAGPASATGCAQASAATDAKPDAKPAPKKLYKSVDLIVATIAHRVMDDVVRFEQATTQPVPLDELASGVARKLLCEISHDAAPSIVLFALGAIGGPASLEEITQRLQAAREAGSIA